VLATVIAGSLRLVGAGLAIGMLIAAATAMVVVRALDFVEKPDGAAYLTVVAVFLVVAFAAAYVPARRASRVDPQAALRAE
jgi:ABC-type antimicrobial peptide transport system permease subunit